MDSSDTVQRETALLCEALVFIDYKHQRDRVLVAQSQRVMDHVVAAAVRALRRSGRSVRADVHGTSGILLDPEDSYRLAWERPSRERRGHPTITHPPFLAAGGFGVPESALADWRDLARRVVAHDAGAAAAAARLAQDMGVGELLVVVVGGSRIPVKEELEAGWNPLEGAFDDEALNWAGSTATLELALYEGVEGRRLWAFTDRLTSWNTKPERLADWTLAAMELMPSPGTEGRHDDVTAARFRPPDRNDIVLRLGRVQVADDHGALLFGTRATYLFRPWMSAGFQIDAQLIRASHVVMEGSRTVASPYQRELHDAEVELFPVYAVLESHFPRVAGTLPTLGVSGGYAIASCRAQGYETRLLGGWGWAVHGNLRWRLHHVAVGLEGWTQSVQPERDGTDPMTLEPVRERLDFDGWGLSLALTVWQ